MRPLPIDPEHAVLLHVLRSHFGSAAREDVEEPVDWGRVTALAESHGVLQLVGHWAGVRDRAGIPEEAAGDLRDRYTRVLFRNLYLQDVLTDLLKRFEERGIEVLVFKGLVLARDYYGDLGWRKFMDVDLLIHPADALRVRTLFMESGYRPLYPLNEQQARAHIRFQSAQMYDRADGKAQADVQWRLGANCFLHIPDDDLWARARWGTGPDDGGPDDAGPETAPAAHTPRYRTFGHEDTLLHLCAHGAQHRWEALKHVADVAAVLQRYGGSLDWALIRDRARAAGRGQVVALGLALADYLVQAPFASPEENGIERDDATAELARTFAHLLLTTAPGRTSEHERLVRRLYEPSGGWPCRRIIHDVFTPTVLEIQHVTLPRPLWFLYVPLRIVRLTWRDTVGQIRRKRSAGASKVERP